MDTKRKIYFESCGCEQRELELEYFKRISEKNNWKNVETSDEADTILYVVCTVSEEIYKKARQRLLYLCENFKEKTILVYGCTYPLEREFASRVTKLIPVKDRVRIIDWLGKADNVTFPLKTSEEEKLLTTANSCSARAEYDTAKKGYKVIICDGCLNDCAYCVIKYSTGKLRSKKPECNACGR